MSDVAVVGLHPFGETGKEALALLTCASDLSGLLLQPDAQQALPRPGACAPYSDSSSTRLIA
jgi:hypothetical protein